MKLNKYNFFSGRRVTKGRSGRRQKGFTLIELTVVMAMTLVLATALMMMLSSHVNFMRVLSSYQFLRDDAPQVNNMLTGIFGKADSYRIYGSLADAQGDSSAVNSGGTAVRLRFRNPDGTFEQGIVAFETTNGTQLNFYNYDSLLGTWPRSWTISQQPIAVDFNDTSGILLVTMTGPNNEVITYGGTGE